MENSTKKIIEKILCNGFILEEEENKNSIGMKKDNMAPYEVWSSKKGATTQFEDGPLKKYAECLIKVCIITKEKEKQYPKTKWVILLWLLLKTKVANKKHGIIYQSRVINSLKETSGIVEVTEHMNIHIK